MVHFVPSSTERRVLPNKTRLFVCLSVTESKEHFQKGYELCGILRLSEVTRCGKLESEVRLPRMRMVARQPIHRDFSEMGFPGGIETWGTRIRGLFHWGVNV